MLNTEWFRQWGDELDDSESRRMMRDLGIEQELEREVVKEPVCQHQGSTVCNDDGHIFCGNCGESL